MSYRVRLSPKSANVKTGPIPVSTTERATCQLCQRQRSTIVGFPAHGARRRVIDIRLTH